MMLPHTRALIAASAHAFMFGYKVAGVHDHDSGRDLLIAVEVRGNRLQGRDGDRTSSFSGTSSEIHDSGDDAFISIKIEGENASGFDRATSSHYTLTATSQIVQLYDHSESAWYAFSIQVA
jgi:hypothetical protein